MKSQKWLRKMISPGRVFNFKRVQTFTEDNSVIFASGGKFSGLPFSYYSASGFANGLYTARFLSLSW
jgi:hypothetical protein